MKNIVYAVIGVGPYLVRCVCTEPCLLGLGEEVVNTGSTLDLPSELNIRSDP